MIEPASSISSSSSIGKKDILIGPSPSDLAPAVHAVAAGPLISHCTNPFEAPFDTTASSALAHHAESTLSGSTKPSPFATDICSSPLVHSSPRFNIQCWEQEVDPPRSSHIFDIPASPSSSHGQKRRRGDLPLQEAAVPKRTRLQSAARLVLDRFDFSGPSINNTQPSSPLFFSHRTDSRPTLPPRYTSSEAAVKMLSKAKPEEGQVKTVSLARGTISTPLGSGGPLGMRTASDRSSVTRSVSPESLARFDASSNGSSHLLGSIGVVELLDQDERPTMIVDLGESSNYGSGPLRPLYVNPALYALPQVLESVSGHSGNMTPEAGTEQSFIQFKSWLLSAAVNGESLNVCLPAFKYAGMSWSGSTLRKRLRLVSGAFTSIGPPRLSRSPQAIPRSLALSTSLTAKSAPAASEEERDYFGEAGLARPAPITRSSSQDVIPTAETPRSYRASRHQTPLSGPMSGVLENHMVEEAPSFDWTRIPISDNMPPHIQFARSIDWASTALGPIENWCADLRQMCNLIMASPHPAAMYWGDAMIAIYNEAYIQLAGQKHPTLMGQSYMEAWKEIWDEVKDAFANARLTGEATMKDDDCLFIKRSDYLEETYFSWSLIPMVGSDGAVCGLYNPAFEKTRRKIAERRMLTLREIGERTATARDVPGFWQQVISALDYNAYDTPFALLYSVSDDSDSDSSSMHSTTMSQGVLLCHLEGSLGVPDGHPAAPQEIDLRTGTEGFGNVFREVLKTDKPVLLEAGSHELPYHLLDGLDPRGFGDPCKAVVACPIHPTTDEAVLGFLVLGVNPRRPYDEDYSLFLQLLSRQLATSLASVVLFDEEIRRGQRAARLAALDRIQLAEQLAARTQEAIESDTKFTRMAELAPVGMFIANSEGMLTYCNDSWYAVSRVPRSKPVQKWMDAINDEDREMVNTQWNELVHQTRPVTSTFRFKTPWQDPDGARGERWVLFSGNPEKDSDGRLKSVFCSITDISQQKWAEGFQKRKMEEAVELKRQQENFIDMTSHEMRNPLSAILQCADEISTTMGNLKERGDKSSAAINEGLTSTIDAAQTISLCAQHQKRIVDDILTLSKLDSDLLLVTPVDAQPLIVVQRALKMHEGEFVSNDIKSRFVVDASFTDLKIDWVRFDPSRVLQVLINLTTNAIKFTTSETTRTITVSLSAYEEKPSLLKDKIVDYFPTRRAERAERIEPSADVGDGPEVYIQFSVQDTGRGLTAEEKKLLFHRFSQASPRTHVQYGGSGLGLFISRQLTEKLGGEIGVASEAGQGSTFAFYVRARRSVDPATAVPAATPEVAPSKGTVVDRARPLGTKHILLVEDNLVNQRVLQKQLKNLGCVVQVANHGGEALEKLRASTWYTGPDRAAGPHRAPLSVVLMDQEMPVMDGLTATRRIREMEKVGRLAGHVPVIGVTANARSEQIRIAMDAGMDDVVSKPFRIPDLIPKIEELMGRHPEPEKAP